VIDHNVHLARIIRRALAVEHQVTIAMFAEDALDHLYKGVRFDVILCDAEIPWLSAGEFYERVTKIDRFQAERIVFMGGRFVDVPVRVMLAQRPGSFIEKPLDMSALRALVVDYVTRRWPTIATG
jgi:DNA-binding NtrC family response regulator